MIKLYQSHLGDEELKLLSPSVIPWNIGNNTQNNTREYELFKAIATENSSQPWGLISKKFSHKALLSAEAFYQFADEKLNDGFDCAFVNPMIGNEALYLSVWQQGVLCGHAGLDKIMTFLDRTLGLPLYSAMDRNTFAFCNYFVAKPAFWRDYFSFVDNALKHLDQEASNGTEVGKIYSGSGSYHRDSNITMRPFVVERLFSTFIQTHKFKVASYVYDEQHYIKKFGSKFGGFLFQLSKLKNDALTQSDKNLLSMYEQITSFMYANNAYMICVFNLDDPPEFLEANLSY
jgi:hypothetical protein